MRGNAISGREEEGTGDRLSLAYGVVVAPTRPSGLRPLWLPTLGYGASRYTAYQDWLSMGLAASAWLIAL